MTDEAEAPAAPLPQPPREVGEDPVPNPGSPQQAAEAHQEPRERVRITLTVARDLASRAGSLNARCVALIRALDAVGVDATEAPGLRGQLHHAFSLLREAAPFVDEAIEEIASVASQLEEL